MLLFVHLTLCMKVLKVGTRASAMDLLFNQLHTLEGHTGEINCVAVSKDGKTIVTGSGKLLLFKFTVVISFSDV